MSPVMLISVVVGATLVTLIAIISLVLAVSLSGDVAHLEAQVRKQGKANKEMEEALAQLKSAQARLAASMPSESKPQAPPAKPSHIDAADPASDCVVKSGSTNAIANCLK